MQASDSNEDYNISELFARLPLRDVCLALVIGGFVFSRLWLALVFQPLSADILIYGNDARQAIDRGQAIYRDVKLEYPPVAWWLIATPRWLSSTPYPEERMSRSDWNEYRRNYIAGYHFELFLADVACFVLIFFVGRKLGTVPKPVLPGVYAAVTAAQPHLIYDSLDVVLLMFLLLWSISWLNSLSSRTAADWWAVASYLFLGLGISFKIVPIFMVPFCLLADVWQARGAWRFATRFMALALAACGPFLLYVPSAGSGVLYPFQYHSERGIHLESIWSTVVQLGSPFGFPYRLETSHESVDIVSGLSTTVKLISRLSILGLGAAFGIWALLRGRRYDRRTAFDLALLVLLNCTILSNLFSPQFLHWMVPIAFVLAASILPPRIVPWCGLTLFSLIPVVISTCIFPGPNFLGLIHGNPTPLAAATVRSGSLVTMALLLDLYFFVRYGVRRSDSVERSLAEMGSRPAGQPA
ncbi:MAG TPA: hypothetical protein VMF30_01830 [Pirellulales bacterium]|nr:hypothetical protein [Pirellulales bacterium]